MNDFPWLVLAVLIIPVVVIRELLMTHDGHYEYHPLSVRRPDELA
jgi:hypothetical protein